MTRPPPAPFLVALPQGFSAGGVVTWGVRLADGLARQGRPAAVLALAEPTDQAPLTVGLEPSVTLYDLRASHVADARAGRLAPFLPTVRDAVFDLADRFGPPVVVSPNLLGDCYGLFAAIAQVAPELIRIIGVQHADIEYDARVLARYEPVVARFVGVSVRLADELRRRIPARACDIESIPHGVVVPPAPARRDPPRGRPVRLVYTGRIEHKQKRIGALLALSDELTARRIDHELTLIGDGPALAEARSFAATRPRIRLPGPLPPAQVAGALDRADAFVLASRYEGLSVSMIEAQSRGCWPIVTAVASGAAEAVEPGASGDLVEVPPDADDGAVARALANAVERFNAADQRCLSEGAWRCARERFSVEEHVARWARTIDAAGASPARRWPLDLPCAFTGSGGGGASGAVPPGAAEALRAALARLAGRRVVVHGAGRHTIELAPEFAGSPAEIVLVTDDDPARWGRTLLGWRIARPEQAGAAGATDVLLSSWMHSEEMWRRRAVFERQGLTVHRLYP